MSDNAIRRVIRSTLARTMSSRLAARLPERVTLRMLERGLRAGMARDDLASLPNGIHVLLCGAGSPLPDPKRSGPCVAIQAGSHLFLFDAGANCARNLSRFSVNPGRVEAVLLTHAHSDHIDGLGELGVLRWANAGADTPLPVHGPPVITEVVEGFNRAYAPDAGYRIEHHGPEVVPPGGAGMEAIPFLLPTDEALHRVIETDDGVRIGAFAVSHDPVSEAVGYRIDYRDRSVVLSGDTTKSANVIRHAQGVDLLVHEALGKRFTEQIASVAKDAGNTRAAAIMNDIESYHATPLEAAESAAEAGAGQLLLYHIAPPLVTPAMERLFLKGTADVYEGKVTLGADGTLISLPRAQ